MCCLEVFCDACVVFATLVLLCGVVPHTSCGRWPIQHVNLPIAFHHVLLAVEPFAAFAALAALAAASLSFQL